jgi:succinoglycan biosynthesis protein ExoL
MKIAYFAHNINDSAVARRVEMLTLGGARVHVAAFRRGEPHLAILGEAVPIDLGQTFDGRFVARATAGVTAAYRLGPLQEMMADADVVIGRNLETMPVATRARARLAPSARLIYECLDIHRLLLRQDWIGAVLGHAEARLMRSADLLLTSSAAFAREYFEPRGRPRLPVLLVENRVIGRDGGTRDYPPSPAIALPWRIGWYGVLRCQQSLDLLCSLAEHMQGAVEVVLRGTVAHQEFRDFHAQIAGCPHVTYGGPYRNPDDLSAIYGDVHFVWGIDYFEAGGNSRWLLPNRLYEGSYHGSVVVADAEVEVGRFLTELDAGVQLNEPLGSSLPGFFEQLDAGEFTTLREKSEAIPRSRWLYTPEDCATIVTQIAGRKS